MNGEPVFRTDGVWRVLSTVARSPYCLAIADLGRALGFYDKVSQEAAVKVLERWRRDPNYLFAIKTIEQGESRPGGGPDLRGPTSVGDGTL